MVVEIVAVLLILGDEVTGTITSNCVDGQDLYLFLAMSRVMHWTQPQPATRLLAYEMQVSVCEAVTGRSYGK